MTQFDFNAVFFISVCMAVIALICYMERLRLRAEDRRDFDEQVKTVRWLIRRGHTSREYILYNLQLLGAMRWKEQEKIDALWKEFEESMEVNEAIEV